MEVSVPAGPMAARPSANTNSGADDPAAGPSSAGDDGAGPSFPTFHEHLEDESRIQMLRIVNGASFLLTGVFVVGLVLFQARQGGVFGDEFLWMKYQTLVTPAGHVDLIWFPIFLLEGLFVYASTFHATLKDSPLAGYDVALSSPRTSVAAHCSALCAATLLAVHSHDRGRVGLAFLGAALQVAIAADVLRIQGRALDAAEAGGGAGGAADLRSRALEHAALRLPFELHGGHALALACLYFNAFLDGFDRLNTMVYLVVADASLAGLLCAGFVALWRTDRKLYGVGAALVWYLLGVAVELHSPSQPIYNEFSDGAILATQVVAGVAATALATLLGVRAMKTAIREDAFGCVDALDGDGSVDASEGAAIGAGYVRA